MDSAAILRLEYEAQHFGFHPRSLLDLIYNGFYENLLTGLTHMKNFMTEQYSKVLPPYVIQSQTDNILQSLLQQLDKSIDKLEVYLNSNVFSIPNHVVLPEDLIHIKNPVTKDEVEKLDKEIAELKQKILDEKAKRFAVKQKIVQQKQVKQQLESLHKELKYLIDIASSQGVSEENVESLSKNLLKLSELGVYHLKSDQ